MFVNHDKAAPEMAAHTGTMQPQRSFACHHDQSRCCSAQVLRMHIQA